MEFIDKVSPFYNFILVINNGIVKMNIFALNTTTKETFFQQINYTNVQKLQSTI